MNRKDIFTRPAGGRSGQAKSEKDIPPFPGRQMFILGKQFLYLGNGDVEGRAPSETFFRLMMWTTSTLQNVRADCLHVHLPLHLLHDRRLPYHRGRD
jgi:hypothetical protein